MTSFASSALLTLSQPKIPGPVASTRGPIICPTSTASPYETTSACDVCGSRVVVTPYARFAVYMYGCGECTPHCGHMCACTSTNPGMMVLPDTSIVRAPLGT